MSSRAAVVVLIACGWAALLAGAASAGAADAPPATGGVSIAFDGKGLSSLRWHDHEYLADGAFAATWADHVWMPGPDGAPAEVELKAPAIVDAGKATVARRYPWGWVRCVYAADGDQLHLTLTIANESAKPILAAQLRLMLLRLPAKPDEYLGNNPLLNIGYDVPPWVLATCGDARLAVCDDDATHPLVFGLPWPEDRPGCTVFPLVADTGHRGGMPDSLIAVDRPIHPGCSDRYRLSLRFAPSATPLAAQVADAQAAFLARHPPRLTWDDRRPIGTLHLATTVPHVANNPRGWFGNDKTVDTTTPEGCAALATRWRAHVAGSIAQLQRLDAQGVIVWDLEGQEQPHATSYIGDPRHLPPEMEPFADELFAAYAAAGMRTGVTIRPQLIVSPPYGDRAPQQVDLAPEDATRLVIEKIAYAKKRWGCTLFYVDSNVRSVLVEGGKKTVWPTLDAAVFERIAAAQPDVLVIPEHKEPAYWGCSAPYGELRQDFTGTPAAVAALYPRGFSVIYVPDGDVAKHREALAAATRRGDILLFRSWWPDPFNDQVLALRQEASR